jgi:ABC-type uncharacterized transport system ATPase subunit
MEQLPIQMILLASTIAGGMFAIVSGLIRIIDRMITEKRKKSNGFLPTDRLVLENSKRDMSSLLSALKGFEKSHTDISRDLRELARSQTEMTKSFAVFLSKFTEHMEQFRCFGDKLR